MMEIEQHHHQIIKLFEKAGVRNSARPYMEPVGFGQLASGRVSVFDNLTNLREDIVGIIIKMFNQAIGTYRSRMWDAFNPIYWLEFIINLPKEIFVYLGVPTESMFIRITQFIYWLLAVIFGFLFALYRTEIEMIIKDWINKLAP